MRPVRSDRKLELHQKLIGRWPDCVLCASILPAHLAELAWPVRKDCRLAFVAKLRIIRTLGVVITNAREPSPRKLVVAGHVVTQSALHAERLLPPAPNELRPAH